jgi:hypothetical protein
MKDFFRVRGLIVFYFFLFLLRLKTVMMHPTSGATTQKGVYITMRME